MLFRVSSAQYSFIQAISRRCLKPRKNAYTRVSSTECCIHAEQDEQEHVLLFRFVYFHCLSFGHTPFFFFHQVRGFVAIRNS